MYVVFIKGTNICNKYIFFLWERKEYFFIIFMLSYLCTLLRGIIHKILFTKDPIFVIFWNDCVNVFQGISNYMLAKWFRWLIYRDLISDLIYELISIICWLNFVFLICLLILLNSFHKKFISHQLHMLLECFISKQHKIYFPTSNKRN